MDGGVYIVHAAMQEIVQFLFALGLLSSIAFFVIASHVWAFSILPGFRFISFIITKQQYGPQVGENTLLCGLT